MNLPNKISILRIILVPCFVTCLLYWRNASDGVRYIALGIFLTASIADALDGYLARTRNCSTHLGSLLDPLADKLLLSISFVSLTFIDTIPPAFKLPIWVTVIVISRDLFILSGAGIIFVLRKEFKPHTNILGKITTATQMICIVFILTGIGKAMQMALMTMVACVSIASGISYLRHWTFVLSEENSA